jgi:pteridine reductase
MSPVALVTGGAVRTGRAITLALADAGYDMVVNYHTSEEPARSLKVELTSQGREVLLAPGDVSDASAVERIGQEVRERFGRLDVLINSAATFISTPLLEIESAEWDHVMGVNLKGPHLLVREFAPVLRSSRGSIVNVADHMGLKPWVRYAHHSIAKAGLIHLTKIQAVALAPEVRVNAVAPGLVLAPESMSEAAVEREIESTLLQRPGTPEDMTRTVLFLVQSPFVTGQTIVVDGGGTLDQTAGFY